MDFEDARKVFEARHARRADERANYGEARFISAGRPARRVVVIVWTARGEARHAISMRRAHDKEAKRWEADMG